MTRQVLAKVADLKLVSPQRRWRRSARRGWWVSLRPPWQLLFLGCHSDAGAAYPLHVRLASR